MTQQKNKVIPWLYRHIHRRIPSLLLLAVSNIIGAYVGVRFAVVVQNVIDSATAGNMDSMVRACMLLGVIILINVLTGTLSLHVNEMLRANLDRDFKKSIIRKILHSDYSQISQYHSGDLVHRLNGDVSSVYTSLLAILSTTTSLVTSLATAVLVLLNMAPGFTVAIVLISGVVAVFTLLIQKRMKDLHKAASSASGKVSGFFQEIIGKLLIVQALDVSDEIEKRADVILEQRWQIHRKRKNVFLSMNLGSSALSYIGSFITLIWCSWKLYEGEITFGELTAMTTLIGYLQTPMLTLPTLIPKVITIGASCERLMEIEDLAEQSGTDMKQAEALYEKLCSVSTEALSFAYDREPVFQNVSLDIPKGGLTVIVGQSGIGKSTLLKLMLGVYRPASGRLFLRTADGEVPVDRSARALFSYAPQGNLLLSGTLRENIILARPDATEEAIRNALYVSAMDEYVASLPDGLDTVLGENGAGLSEGQAQRISLARAVLRDAPILLLDEVTSALDPRTERTVLERICALPGKTCIAVTHRPAALELADRKITVTEEGMTLSQINHL